jgi:hypothetical protein
MALGFKYNFSYWGLDLSLFCKARTFYKKVDAGTRGGTSKCERVERSFDLGVAHPKSVTGGCGHGLDYASNESKAAIESNSRISSCW